MFHYDEESNITQVGFKDFSYYNNKKINSCVFKAHIYDFWHIYLLL